MLTRLTGFVILGNTILPPALLILAVILFGWVGSVLNDGFGYIGQQKQKLNDQYTAMVTELDNSTEAFRTELRSIHDDLSKTKEKLTQPISDIDVSISNISNMNLRIPNGVKVDGKFPKVDVNLKYKEVLLGDELKKPFSAVNNSLKAIKSPFAKLSNVSENIESFTSGFHNNISAMKENATRIISKISELQTTILTIFKVIFWIVLGLVLWLCLSYMLWFRSRLIRGWSLLRHAKEPDVVSSI